MHINVYPTEYGGDTGSTARAGKGKHAVEGHYVKNQNKTIPEREIALAA